MPVEFCEHLQNYGLLYTRAEASYGNCVHLLETFLEQLENHSLGESLAQSLKDWQSETGRLRQEFHYLVKEGTIDLVRNPEAKRQFHDGRFPLCSECSFEVPRLEFQDFAWDDQGRVTFKGKELPRQGKESKEADQEPAPALTV